MESEEVRSEDLRTCFTFKSNNEKKKCKSAKNMLLLHFFFVQNQFNPKQPLTPQPLIYIVIISFLTR